MAEHFTLICPDLRGYNLSGRPVGVSSYTSELVAIDLVELMDQLGHKQVYLAGHDWGGAIAYHLAAYHPDQIIKASVLNCPHPSILVRNLKSNFAQLKRSWYILFFQLPYLPELLIRRNLDGFLKAVYRPSRFFPPEEIEHYREALLQPGALTATINYYRAAGRAVLKPPQRWPRIACPFQLIWGVRDSALGLELTEGLERYVEGEVRRDLLEDSGHWVHNQEPEVVSGLLKDFLL